MIILLSIYFCLFIISIKFSCFYSLVSFSLYFSYLFLNFFNNFIDFQYNFLILTNFSYDDNLNNVDIIFVKFDYVISLIIFYFYVYVYVYVYENCINIISII